MWLCHLAIVNSKRSRQVYLTGLRRLRSWQQLDGAWASVITGTYCCRPLIAGMKMIANTEEASPRSENSETYVALLQATCLWGQAR